MTEEESFAELYEQSLKTTGYLEPGQKVTAKIISIGKEYAYIDLGGKSEGVIPIQELVRDEGGCLVNEGDQIEAFFLSVQDGMRRFTTMAKGFSTLELRDIYDAYQAGLPVEGTIQKDIKGGFAVLVGRIRCFCPFSQMDQNAGKVPDTYSGATLPFRILEYKDDGKNIVLSRRALIEEERNRLKEEIRQNIKVDMEVDGKVKSIQKFGVFVDIGGIDGLIPSSEVSWDKAVRPGETLSVGQDVRVMVTNLDWENDRITLSLKAMEQDPWQDIDRRYKTGETMKGIVVRLAPFGAFISLEPGVDGLIHISKLGAGKRIKHPNEVVQTGQSLDVRILSVDEAKRRISLCLATTPEDAEQEEFTHYNEYKKNTEQSGDSLGSLGDILRKKLGDSFRTQ